ncbi:MAG: glycosyl hydrolase family 38 [Bacteroidetes bacterium]|nr:glycosyl hydrolase family 38 [Bacteroidota bacterium]
MKDFFPDPRFSILKPFTLAVFLLFLISSVFSQNTPWLSGYKNRISGEVLGYHSAMKGLHQSLLVRSLDSANYIEWETAPIPEDYTEESVEFAWLANYDVSRDARKYKMYLNDELYFIFRNSEEEKWVLEGEKGAKLRFENQQIDRHGDNNGYHYLILPTANFEKGKPIRIKVEGESAGTRTWYMMMMYDMEATVKMTVVPAVFFENGNRMRDIRVDITHHFDPVRFRLEVPGKSELEGEVHKGSNSFTLKVPAPPKEDNYQVHVYFDQELHSTHEVTFKPVRKFDVYLLPHSHVDIGYTHLQEEVERKQWRNFELGIELAQKTANYPEGARFKWNAEIFWAVESYLKNASPEKKKIFLDAVDKGWIGLDALFGNNLTGLMRPEELMQLCGEYLREDYEKYGFEVNSAMISDVPGYSWGIVPALAHNGVQYFSSGPNYIPGLPHGGDRVGYTLEAWGDIPFYWESPSGNQKVLFWVSSHGYSWFHPLISKSILSDRSDIEPVLDFLGELFESGYPYDMIYFRYTIGGDNGPPDVGLPEFVKDWNTKYEYPKFHLSTTSEVFSKFEKKYGDQLPVYRGDFTPYWEDGAGSSAHETALAREASRKLIQASTLWSMLAPEKYPNGKFHEGWRNVLLFNEHTWGAFNSVSEPESDLSVGIWKGKKEMATLSDELSTEVLKDLLGNRGDEMEIIKAIEVFNTTSWPRTDLVKIPADWKIKGDKIIDSQGNVLLSQRLSGGELAFVAKDIPSFGSAKFFFKKSKKQQSKNNGKTEAFKFSNGDIELEIDEKSGEITSLKSRSLNTDFVDVKQDFGLNHYVYTGQNAEKPRTNGPVKILVLDDGPLVKRVSILSDAPGCNSMQREIQLVQGLDKVFINNTIDKKEVLEKENVRFGFPFQVQNGEMLMDLAWGVMEPEKDQLKGANKNFFSGQCWVDISNENTGITWANVDAPLIEAGGMNAEAWMADTYRPWIRTHQPTQLLYSWVMNNSWHTNYKASQGGQASFRYALMPHGKTDVYELKRFGIEAHQPLLLAPTDKKSKPQESLFQLSGDDSVMITSVRPGKDTNTLIVRLFNAGEGNARTKIISKKVAKQIWISDPFEAEIEKTDANLEFAGWEIKTLKIAR